MIVGKDIHPQRELYYLGALVLDILAASPHKEIEFLALFQEMKEREKTTLNIFSLTLDWLYILGAIEGEKGYIKRCF